jgi:2-dehydro-3-deoxyphosphooctonate aldolase (KDO 8-P synthase)
VLSSDDLSSVPGGNTGRAAKFQKSLPSDDAQCPRTLQNPMTNRQDAASSTSTEVQIGNVRFSNAAPLALIAGPCQIESRDHALKMASELRTICERVGMGLIYKSSFDKANRTSLSGARGIGLAHAIPILAEVREKFGIPVITDVHESWQCAAIGEAVDVLQIPAFLCRQTDLLLAAARACSAVNVKKGQFLAPWDMSNVVTKLVATGNRNILVTERGTTFGYNRLVVDMRSLPIMAQNIGAPIIFDATHSVQEPGGLGRSSGGDRKFVSYLARAAVAVGVSGIFIETHDDPDRAPSDGPNMLPIQDMEELLRKLKDIDALTKTFNGP